MMIRRERKRAGRKDDDDDNDDDHDYSMMMGRREEKRKMFAINEFLQLSLSTEETHCKKSQEVTKSMYV